MSESPPMETFPANARAALENQPLRGALRHATRVFAGRRASAVESLPEWEALHRGLAGGGFQDDIVASYVCDRPGCSPIAGEAAYQRVNRHLKALGDELGLPAPVHLHRLRRTLAVQALRTTKDMTIVQQLLGHASLSSTERYVDEVRTDAVGRLQKKLRQYHKAR